MQDKNQGGSDFFRAIIFKEQGKYVAQCLEKDICVQGADLPTLFKRLTGTIHLETPHMGSIPPAPKRFFDMWKDGEAPVS